MNFLTKYGAAMILTAQRVKKTYHKAVEKLGRMPVVTAKQVGMKTIGVYDRFLDKLAEKMREIADRYIFDFDEL